MILHYASISKLREAARVPLELGRTVRHVENRRVAAAAPAFPTVISLHSRRVVMPKRSKNRALIGAFCLVFGLFGHLPGVRAENPLVIAVSANFSLPMRDLAHRFEGKTGRRLAVVSGSTGKHYAQITNGAPFDLFFSADEDRPRRLEQDGLAVAGRRVTYAAGRLVLWSANENLVDPAGKVLSSDAARHLAIANPRLAPYGRAAMGALEGLGVQDLWSSRLLRGENVAQAYQFVAAGNADLGLVALSQVIRKGGGSSWLVPEDLYEPILQQAVVLSRAPGAKEFLEYVMSPEARELIRSYGYRVPAPSRPQRGVDGER